MPSGKTKRSATKNASAGTSARPSKGTSKGTSKKSTKRDNPTPQDESGATADVSTRRHGSKSAVEGETQPDGEGNESDFWVKRPRGG